jgi:hypothetical protein
MPTERQSSRKSAPGAVRRASPPRTARPSLPTRLQRSLGNSGAQAFLQTIATQPAKSSPTAAIQAKLTVGPPDDMYEREADAAAERVTAGRPVERISRLTSGGLGRPQQRQPELEEVEPVQMQEVEEEEERQTTALQRQEMEEEERVQMQREALPAQRMCENCRGEAQRQRLQQPIQTQAEDEEEPIQMRGATSPVQPMCENCRGEAQRQEEEEEGAVQSKPRIARPIINAQRAELAMARSGSGRPLSSALQAQMEDGFDTDFSGVRVHTGFAAGEAAQALNARAFTRGSNIYLGRGESPTDRALMAHELTHVVQQEADHRHVQAETIRNQAEESYDEPVFEPTDTELEGMEEGEQVEQIGIVQTDDGANLWSKTDRNEPLVGLLPQNTRVFVDRKFSGDWYSVYVEGHQRQKSLPVPEGAHGYVDASRVNLDMPDPGAWLFRITKSGQGALAVAGEVYKDNFKASWGKDYRYLVNVLVALNEAKGRRFLYKEDSNDPWHKAKTKKGQIWVPGLDLVNALHGQVSSGSISYEILSTLADITIGVAAFIVGLLHGAAMSIADIFIGAYDLIVLAKEIITKLFEGSLISSAKAFFEEISKIEISALIAMVGAKWNHPNTWDRWKFRGYVIGYAIVEILLMIFSVGIVTAVKWAGKAAKLGKLARYLSNLPRVQKLVKGANALKGKGVDQLRAALKAANALSEAHGWAARTLRIPMQILRRLSEVDISKLKKLPQWARERFAPLAGEVKLRLLGCTSPCKVNVDEIEEALRLAAKGGNKLTTSDEVVAVLKRLNGKLKIEKISSRLRRKDSAIMEAIQKSGLTDADFAKMVDYLTPGDLENPAQAYRTFVRYLTAVVPAKTGKDIGKLNEIAAALVKIEPRRGAALKGAMFEQWIALHVTKLAGRTFSRISFDLRKLLRKRLPPHRRSVDKWVPDKGEIWEIKHQMSRVPIDQVEDYAGLVGKKAPDGKLVKSINYIFPTKGVAEMNRFPTTNFAMNVFFIDKAGALRLLM